MTELKKTRGKLATKLDWRDNCPAKLFRLKWCRWMLFTDDGGKQWTLKKCGNRKIRLVQGSCRLLHLTTCQILADFFEKELHQQTTSDWAKVAQLKQNNFFVFLYYIKQIYFRIFHIVVNVFLITFNAISEIGHVKFVPLYLGRLITCFIVIWEQLVLPKLFLATRFFRRQTYTSLACVPFWTGMLCFTKKLMMFTF